MCVRVSGEWDIDMYRLKRVGESTDPRGTPFLYCLVEDGLPLCSVYTCLHVRKLASHFLWYLSMLVLYIF